ETSENGYQTMQALYAIGSGGLFGRGLGQSIQKTGYIPETHTDMIFSVICEELGIIGGIGIIVIFGILLWRLRMIAEGAPDRFGSLLVVGVIIHIGFQVVVNLCVVTNLMPNTGVTLPFVSYGGSSLLFLLMEVGFVLAVSRQIRPYKEGSLATPEEV
ncbi:MAG TPA: cell division protein, partial [Lachnospiraceae bacterium]|nr:cell division protein [Lachnospiraceae bacterium]